MNYPKFLGETLHFDPLQKPPRLEYALKHQQATQCGYISENADFCPCCGIPIPNKILSLSIKIIDLSFLGQGVPLFFNHTTLIILLHFLLFFIFTAPNVIQNYQVNDCIDPNNYALTLWQIEGCKINCPLNHQDYQIFVYYFQDCNTICLHYNDICVISQTSAISYVNKQTDNEGKLIQSSLVLCSIIILKISLVLIRERQRKMEYQIDKDLLSPSDFTAILNYLPQNNYNEKELKQALEQYCKEFDSKNKYEVVKINVAYDISQFVDSGRQKLKLEKKLVKNNLSPTQSQKIKSKIQEIEKNQKLIEYEIENGCYTKTTQIAFVTFQTKQQLQNLLAHTKLSYWETWMLSLKSIINSQDNRGFYFKGQLITINRAPEPDDVFWENCGVDEKSQRKRKVVSFFVILILLGISFGILYGLNEFKNLYLKKEAHQLATKTMISLSKSLIVTIADGLIYYFITLLADQERHVTKTQQDASISQKLTYVQFINSCLLLVLISVIGSYNQTSDLNGDQKSKLSLQQQGGIADDIVYVAGANALLKPLSAYFNPVYFLNKLKQKRIEKQQTMNQIEANKLFEGPEVEFYDQYSHLVKTTWMSVLFAPLAPISVFFGLIGLTAFYWIQKYLLLRRNRRPPFFSSHLDRDMLYLMDLSPILFSIMQFWLDQVFDSSQLCQTINLASLVIAGSEIIFPSYRVHRLMFKDECEEEELVRYEDIYLKLPTDYDRMNPLTQSAAMQELVENKLKLKKQPLKLELSQNLFASKGKRNQALQDLIRKGICDPKQVRLKILKQKLKLVVKMRNLQCIKSPNIKNTKDEIKEQSLELNFIEKVESFKSSYRSSPTYLKTPEYNFSSIVNIQPQNHQYSEVDANSLFSQQAKNSYLDTPKYYFSTQKHSLFKSIITKMNSKNK